MSVILTVCGTNFITIVSDGRLVEKNEKSEIIAIPCEELRKVWKVTDRIVVGFGGNANVLIGVIEHLKTYSNLEKLDINNITRKIQREARRIFQGNFKSMIFVGGKNSCENYVLSILSSENNFEIDMKSPIPNSLLSYGFFPNTVNTEEMLEKYVYNPYSTGSFKTLNDIISSLESCIIEISNIDNTVNDKIFKEVVKN